MLTVVQEPTVHEPTWEQTSHIPAMQLQCAFITKLSFSITNQDFKLESFIRW
jgi:hypothetical protein